jgi:hypothetical protein
LKPNYGAEKRRKELERKKKQEEKLQKRLDRKNHPGGDESPEQEEGATTQTDSEAPSDS